MKRFQLSLWVCLVVCFGFSTYAQDTKEIIILQTSDVHSRIEPINQKGDRNYDEGGFVRRATFLDQFRKEHKNVLLFDCGDISQGTPYYNMFRGEVEVKLMNEMGYDAMTIGNHEFMNSILIWTIWLYSSKWLNFRWFVPITIWTLRC